jgi:N-formylglutamate amidohydrolase
MADRIKYFSRNLVARHRGTLPLLLTCPHEGTQRPRGVPEREDDPDCNVERDSDLETRSITVQVAERLLELCGQSPSVVIAEFRRAHIDANRRPRCAYQVDAAAPFYDEYHATVRELVDGIRSEHAGLGWLVDLHGSRVLEEDPADVYLGTANGASVRRLLEADPRALFRHRSLRGMLTAAGYGVSPVLPGTPDPPPFAGGYTVQTYGSSHDDGIDALQVEVTFPIRTNEEARAAFTEQLAQALAVMAQDLVLTAWLARAGYGGGNRTSGPGTSAAWDAEPMASR